MSGIPVKGLTGQSRHKAKVVIYCKNSLIGAGIGYILTGACFTVSGIASDEASLSRYCVESSPDLFIVDASDASGPVVETVRALKGHHPEARVVLIADHFDLRFMPLAQDAGVDGFCLSASAPEVLIKSLELVILGEAVLPTALISSVLDGIMKGAVSEPQPFRAGLELELRDPAACRLSTREAEVLTCLTRGESNKIIARQFDVAEATVKVHVKAILRKIGATNRTQAAIWATEHFLTKSPAAFPA